MNRDSHITPLYPIHASVHDRWQQSKRAGFRIRPVKMDAMTITHDQREHLERVVLDIFTDMTNAGASIQEILSAIYLSGVQHTIAILGKETRS